MGQGPHRARSPVPGHDHHERVMKPLQGSAPVREFFTSFSRNPLLGIFAGMLVTLLVQSSSATVGLTMTLAGSGLIGLQGAFFLVLGTT